jgi:hypothetical protein
MVFEKLIAIGFHVILWHQPSIGRHAQAYFLVVHVLAAAETVGDLEVQDLHAILGR